MSKLYDLLNTLITNVNASVKTTAQTLTETQKVQARQNIGAAAVGEGGEAGSQWFYSDMRFSSAEIGGLYPFFYENIELGGRTIRVGDFIINDKGMIFQVEGVYDTNVNARAIIKLDGNSGGINVSGAVPGQTIVVKEVDANGTPTAWEPVDFPEGGGATKWEDLGSKFEESVIFPETSLAYDEDVEAFIIFDYVPVEAGNTYIVNWNGVEYVCTAFTFSFDGMTATILGDIGAMQGAPTTGEPFIMMFVPADMVEQAGAGANIMALDGSTEITLSITDEVEKITPIPEKYLPKSTILYRSSGGTLYKTADTSNPENILTGEELKFMVERATSIYVQVSTDDGSEKYMIPTEITFYKTEGVAGLLGLVVTYVLNTAYTSTAPNSRDIP